MSSDRTRCARASSYSSCSAHLPLPPSQAEDPIVQRLLDSRLGRELEQLSITLHAASNGTFGYPLATWVPVLREARRLREVVVTPPSPGARLALERATDGLRWRLELAGNARPISVAMFDACADAGITRMSVVGELSAALRTALRRFELEAHQPQ